MNKFLAVVKHEYKKVVLKWSFLIGTLLLPVMAVVFSVVPALIFSIKGEPTRIAIVDPTDNVASRLKANLSSEKMAERAKKAAEESLKNLSPDQQRQLETSAAQFQDNFIFVEVDPSGRSVEELRQSLLSFGKRIDAYLIVPNDINAVDAVFEFRSRKSSIYIK